MHSAGLKLEVAGQQAVFVWASGLLELESHCLSARFGECDCSNWLEALQVQLAFSFRAFSLKWQHRRSFSAASQLLAWIRSLPKVWSQCCFGVLGPSGFIS